MVQRDEWAKRAHAEGYRSRAAYKLQQLDDEFGILSVGDTVVDLGAAPGGWLQIAAEAVGEDGTVIGVDRRRIDPLDDTDASTVFLRGDVTAEDVREQIVAAAAGHVDVVLSDMAPDISGAYDLDHARSIGLAEAALETALVILAPGGTFVVKVFEGRDLATYRTDLETEFEFVATARPAATRATSSEVYLVASGRLTAPVRPDDVLTVSIVDTGAEGDGIAKVDGFTLFVPDAEEGAVLEVRVVDVKPRFGFAEIVGPGE